MAPAQTRCDSANMPYRTHGVAPESNALSAAFFQALIDSNPDAVAVLDEHNRLLVWNSNYATLWGEHNESLQRMSNEERWVQQRQHLANPDVARHAFPALFTHFHQDQREEFQLADGRWFERHVFDHRVDGHKVGLVIHWRDITDIHHARRAAQYERELTQAMMDSIPDQIFFKDLHSRFIRINPALAKRYGLADPKLAVGKSDYDFYGAEHAAKTARDEAQIMETGEPLIGVVDHEVWPDGSTAWNVSTKMPLYDPTGRLIGTYGIAHDITEHKKSELLIWQQANFDALTNLPNRRLLRDRWMQAVKNQTRSGLGLAFLMLDLDHFKEINDTLGHAMGDLLLVEAAQRITGCLRSTDTVARLGGDEFAVILTELAGSEPAAQLSQKIIHALAQPFQLGAETAYVTASVGITLSPGDSNDIDVLFKHADQAMYLSKSRGRNRFSFFTPELETHSQQRLRLANDLRQAVCLQQLFLLYQPIVELATGRVHKAEALLRWQHPHWGLVSPAEFIPLAESSGLIVEMGEWVFKEAACAVQHWCAAVGTPMQVSINKSPVQFQQQDASPQRWLAHLHTLGLDGSAVVIEITESLLLENSAQVRHQLADMRAAGMQVSLDDFGTGYSALSYLQRYDIDYIKIDQSFVRDLAAPSKNMALCKAIIHMAHELGMKVVAEGIETAEQHALLRSAGCDYGQGYLFARPLSSEALVAFAKQRNAP
jgi:diguanylate cyclase (GGDEF)-like protein/PAS domain S-box-containing protein